MDYEKLKKKKFHELIPAGYEQHWYPCETKKGGYSGVAIFTKIKPMQVLYGIQKAKHDMEGRVLTAEFK